MNTESNYRLEQVKQVATKPATKKQKYFKLTFHELLTILCAAAVPIAIGIYTTITTDRQTKAAKERRQFDLKQATELQQRQIYNDFIDNIYTLHRDDELNETSKPWAFANARYKLRGRIVAYRQWDAGRKAHALQFLKEKGLIGREQCTTGCEVKQLVDIIRLNELDLDNVQLTSQTGSLNKLNMKCVQFDQVSMVNASFNFVNLNGASFDGSRLNGAKFKGSSLICASFNGTELQGTDFGDSDLRGAQFINVNLSMAEITSDQMQQAICHNTITNGTASKSTVA
ncbi:unnamed protein product, partial [Didymodactylos carnosus]